MTFDEGDAEQLPYADGQFDIVITAFGAMFAPRPERVAAEMVRVVPRAHICSAANLEPTRLARRQRRITRLLSAAEGLLHCFLW